MGALGSRSAAALIDFDSDVGHVIVAESASLRRDERAAILQQCMPDCSDGPGTLTYAVVLHALNLWAHCWYSAARDASAPRGARQRCVVLLLPPSGIDGRAAVEAAGPAVLAAADAGGAAGARRALDELLQAGQSQSAPAHSLAHDDDALRALGPDAWTAWECVVSGAAPLVVKASTPERCSAAVLALADLLAPLPCVAWPYVSVEADDAEALLAAERPKRAPLPDVAGVANALFTRSGGRWCARLDLDGGGRFSSGGRFECDGRPPARVRADHAVLRHGAAAVREHFRALTARLLQPLEHFASAGSLRAPPAASPLCAARFDRARFLEELAELQPPPLPTSVVRTTRELVDLYAALVAGPMFERWWAARRRRAHADAR